VDDAEVIESAKADLRKDLDALPTNNVVVLDHKELLAEVSEDKFWDHPSQHYTWKGPCGTGDTSRTSMGWRHGFVLAPSR